MKIAFFDAKDYDREYFDKFNNDRHQITYFKENLTLDTINKVQGFDAVCVFVNTYGNQEILETLHKMGIKFWLQRSMGYNKVDLAKANELGIEVFRIFNYSAESVAEMAVLMLMTLNRNLLQAQKRISNYNFSINGLQGLCVNSSTVGVIGGGKIGQAFIRIIRGMGAKILVYDPYAQEHFPDLAQKMGFEFVSLNQLFKDSDFISLHAPLLASTRHIINKEAIEMMKESVIIVNTARGELIDTTAILEGLKTKKIRGLATDVLEREEGRFYEDCSSIKEQIQQKDPQWKELIEMDNVLITSHQAYLTDLALSQIAKITLDNADAAQRGDFTNSLKLMKDGTVKNG
ncbi:2-hydroxyacid dehydrogenase [[Mycoplasma] cavipharyngis]|uniref:NAD(P)-dependent oxidoreductase n=1 Tax=[Mycoplasma] cavipharyngis TaxID=92757 RepID=UPI0037038197